ncbi:MAG: adenosylcobinamide-GDP ribazoletransferase [Methylocystaceae bacterium]|nr:adenosylcobinamide-GDP ribazoletransferase [Methylocystaceae bacterium]
MNDTSSTFHESPNSPSAWWDDLQLAVVFLTRLPWKIEENKPPQALNHALRAFPLVGLLVGALSATLLGLAHAFGLPDLAAAFLAVACSVLITGALHEDGLADVADGFGGGADKVRKLDIMRDSRVGAYGVLALIFSIGLRVSALAGFDDVISAYAALIAIACLSRVAPIILLYQMDPARTDGLAATMEKPVKDIIQQGTLLGAGLFLLCSPFVAGVLSLGLAAAALWAFKRMAQAQVGGHSGDICGASQQIVEIVALLGLAAFV